MDSDPSRAPSAVGLAQDAAAMQMADDQGDQGFGALAPTRSSCPGSTITGSSIMNTCFCRELLRVTTQVTRDMQVTTRRLISKLALKTQHVSLNRNAEIEPKLQLLRPRLKRRRTWLRTFFRIEPTAEHEDFFQQMQLRTQTDAVGESDIADQRFMPTIGASVETFANYDDN